MEFCLVEIFLTGNKTGAAEMVLGDYSESGTGMMPEVFTVQWGRGENSHNVLQHLQWVGQR